MTRMIFLLICLFCDYFVVKSQENMIYMSHPKINDDMIIKPFKNDNGSWGLINSKTKEIITEPTYKLLGDFIADSFYIFVDKDNRFGVLNSNGSIKVPFDYYGGTLGINRNDPFQKINGIQVAPFKIYGDYHKDDLYIYFINSKGNCELTNYYTCPSNVKIETKDASIGMNLIQKAESFKSALEIDSAVYYCKLAIKTDTANPYFYYWGCKLFLVNECSNISERNIGRYNQYFPWVESCLLKAESIEKNIPYLYRIKSLKYKFYQYTMNDKTKAKTIKIELDSLKQNLKKEKYPEMWLYHY